MKIDKTIKEDLKKVFEEELARRKKKVVIVSPYHLSQEEIANLENTFPRIKNCSLANQVDKSLLAGFIIKQGTQIIDLSIKSKLNKIRSEII